MKRVCFGVICCLLVVALTACGGAAISREYKNAVTKYVNENLEAFSPEGSVQFYNFATKDKVKDSIVYGYYYSENDEPVFPDFYTGDDYDQIIDDVSSGEDGFYWGTPSNKSDWCYTYRITDCWFYFELHQK